MEQSILGIDPSVACSGYALIKGDEVFDLGKLITDKDFAESVRLDEIYKFFKHLVEISRPDIVAMEDQFMGPNPQTSLYLARARGVAMMACYHGGANVVVYAPTEIKRVATGGGKADKKAVQEGILNIYSNSVLVQNEFANGVKTSGKLKNDDISDALAVAHTHKVLQAGRFV